MKKLLLLLMGVGAITAAAQQVTVVENTRLLQGTGLEAHHPVLNADGTLLLFSDVQATGLQVLDMATGQVRRISDEPAAGFEPQFAPDGSVCFVTQRQGTDHLIYRTAKRCDLATMRTTELMEPQHGAVHPVVGTRDVAVRAEKKMSKPLRLTGTSVTVEGSQVIVTRNGESRSFSPVPAFAGYLWPSLSPQADKVAFVAAGKGVVVMDLDGHVLAMPGRYEMPCWLNNDYLVAQNATDDGHQYTSSQIMLLKADGTYSHALTEPTSMTMTPTTGGGKIAYSTIDGQLYLMQIHITE